MVSQWYCPLVHPCCMEWSPVSGLAHLSEQSTVCWCLGSPHWLQDVHSSPWTPHCSGLDKCRVQSLTPLHAGCTAVALQWGRGTGQLQFCHYPCSFRNSMAIYMWQINVSGMFVIYIGYESYMQTCGWETDATSCSNAAAILKPCDSWSWGAICRTPQFSKTTALQRQVLWVCGETWHNCQNITLLQPCYNYKVPQTVHCSLWSSLFMIPLFSHLYYVQILY